MKVNILNRNGHLYLDFSIPEGRVRYSIDEKIGNNEWNSNKQRIRGSHSLNDYLDQLVQKIQATRRELILEENLTVKDFTECLDMIFGKKIKVTTLTEFMKVIQDRKQNDTSLNDKYFFSFNMTINQILRFGDIELNKISKKWIEEWKSFGYSEGYAISSMRFSYRLIRMTLKAAYEEGILKQNYSRISTTFPRNIIINPYNTPEELNQIEEANLIGKLDLVRDLYLIGCETGQRPNVYLKLDKRYIQNDIVHVTQKKTGVPVRIPLTDRLSKLLASIEEKKKKNPKLLAKNDNSYYQNFLFNLPKVCRIAGINTPFIKKEIEYEKWQLIKPHTARRTYTCIRYYHYKEQPMNIMKVTGHLSLQTFERYVQASV